MMDNNYDLTELLDYIDPGALDYQEWVSVGMILKDAGYACSVWDTWSAREPGRYHKGDCGKKWDSFKGASSPVGIGTLVQMAKDNGWRPPVAGNELDWDDTIGSHDEMVVIDPHWVEGQELKEPDNWDPAKQLIDYLSALFSSDENVGYVTQTWERDGKFMPTKGVWDRNAGELINLLSKCNGDIGSVIGDYNPKAGAWIRFNPLDGAGVKNDNVTDFRFALVESDALDLEQQNAIVRQLELPIATLVYSGGKSIHAVVRIDATSYEEYRQRVDYLYDVCKKNGLKVDTQNRNPSRLSRMPGIIRNGHKQFLIDTNIGKSSWSEWKEWIESITDDLPDPEPLTNVWNNMPDLAPSLITGVLRQGHKMLLTGPSKAGKSFCLIELCIAIAEGKQWLGFDCAQGRVMYVNLELDRASCLHRFKDVYQAKGWMPNNLNNIDIWNLRGASVPMDKLAPKLIRRASKRNYIAVIVDPIYKVITGDENDAYQMSQFCNQFDRICRELGASVIICHHHSKGFQGQKRSRDRASGSGVFARDPDAVLDMIELELPAENRDGTKTAWRVEGDLREFESFKPVNIWFDYPRHTLDDGKLKDAKAAGDTPPWQKGSKTTSDKYTNQQDNRADLLISTITKLNSNPGPPPTKDRVWEYLSEQTIDKGPDEYIDGSWVQCKELTKKDAYYKWYGYAKATAMIDFDPKTKVVYLKCLEEPPFGD